MLSRGLIHLPGNISSEVKMQTPEVLSMLDSDIADLIFTLQR